MELCQLEMKNKLHNIWKNKEFNQKMNLLLYIASKEQELAQHCNLLLYFFYNLFKLINKQNIILLSIRCALRNAGYTNVKNYFGSWNEWS